MTDAFNSVQRAVAATHLYKSGRSSECICSLHCGALGSWGVPRRLLQLQRCTRKVGIAVQAATSIGLKEGLVTQ